MNSRLLVGLGLFVLVGCNPKGTCISGADDLQMCALDYPKRACASNPTGQFVEENRVQGLLHCKSAGFDFSPGQGKDVLFKHKGR